jgi:protein involved in polysaccharide export with SLBB domain
VCKKLSVSICLALLFSVITAAAQPPDYVIQPQDILGISVWRNPDLDTEIEVDQDGYVPLPLLGKVVAGGLTLRQFEDELTKLWGRDYIKDPYVRVSLKKKQFFVLGEVDEPGSFEMVGNMTVLKAISMAGGFTAYAAEGGVYILRTKKSGPEKIEIDFSAIQKGRSEDIEIRPGDVLTVPQSFF